MSFLDVESLKKTFAKQPDLIARGLGKIGVKTSVPSVVQAVRDASLKVEKGDIIETAPTAEIFAEPQYPYTQALMRQNLMISNRRKMHKSLEGDVPPPINPPSGCHFHPR